MKTIAHRIYLLPGPTLEQLISDQAKELQQAYMQIERISVAIWVEDVKGVREKSCEVKVRIGNDRLRVTRHGSTHILAVQEAFRTVRNRLARIGWRSTVES